MIYFDTFTDDINDILLPPKKLIFHMLNNTFIKSSLTKNETSGSQCFNCRIEIDPYNFTFNIIHNNNIISIINFNSIYSKILYMISVFIILIGI